MREQILQMNAIQGLGGAIRNLEDIRRLHRLGAWPALPDRYTSLKLELIAIKGRTQRLTIRQQASIQGAIQQLSNIEREAEKAIAGDTPPDVRIINEIISRQIDELAGLLVALQSEMDQTRP